jgi:diguanylate cyclase (GGDEF)-like protein
MHLISQALLDVFPAGVLVADAGLVLRQVNRWLAERLGQPSAELLDRPLGEAFPELAERSLLSAYALVMEQRTPLRLPRDIHRYWVRLPAGDGSADGLMPQSATLVPLLEAERVAGILTIIEDETDHHRAQLRLQREIDKLAALHEVDRALATLDLDDCLQIIVARTRTFFRGENSVLLLCDPAGLRVAAEAGFASSYFGQAVSVDTGVVGWVVTHRQSVLIADVSQDPRYFAVDPRTQSELAAPLLLRDDCLGVISVESARLGAFDDDDREMLEALAARAAAAIHNARLHASAHVQRQLAETLRDITLSLSVELNPDAILDVLLDHAARVVPYDTGCIMQLDPRERRLRMVRHRGYERYGVAAEVAAFDAPLDAIPNLARLASAFTPAVVADTRTDAEWVQGPVAAHIGSWAGAPIVARGALLGILSLDKVEPGFYTPELAGRLAALAAAAGLAWENARLYAEQQQLALTDGLTGIANRRSFDQVLAREMSRALRFDRPLGLILLDLDDFKHFNDSYGHPAGDEMLRSLAMLLMQSVRVMDTAARYGGEEFAVVLPEAAVEETCQAAERLRVAIAQLPFPVAWPAAGLTVSAGVAVAPAHGRHADELVRAADTALYAAKRAGKNRVGLAQPGAARQGYNGPLGPSP